MSSDKTIYILIGQKGSGKTFAGQIIQDTYSIKFVRVEDIAKKVKKARSLYDESYHNEAFNQIEFHLREVLENTKSVVFESTGLGSAFDRMLNSLKRDYKLFTIGIKADPDLCLERITNRDQSTHINVSDEDVIHINYLVRENNFAYDFELNNNGSREALVSGLETIFEMIKSKE
jgi:shikimate kinase